ncbi:50S ribosomal L9 C-terminal domain-containing protein, partial [Streptomyces sp. NPDC029216]|uniref:50S ribosomal L9 C-terminal domain-containing protein n=1 Tax=Streptomyces sp. NPDC029216 TaxID=3154701 RepID=UPI0034045E63
IATAIEASGGPKVDKRRVELGSPIKTLGSYQGAARAGGAASALPPRRAVPPVCRRAARCRAARR